MVRHRADNELVMGKVNIFRLPKSVYPWGSPGDVDFTKPAANYKIGLYPPFAGKEEAMKAVQWELRLEFATEGMRFFDLRRWDKATVGRVDMAATLNAYARADERIRFMMTGAEFKEKAKYMPIPREQIDLQPDVLKQNPGY
ncbi:MAG: RagB/SusD family nutrient uptake outer membrane protein [Bacteroidetes bacterium]|nr:RagB/SusD family nutrient uptake outer membrane protein [Bacteroidota bacterium]